jgi:hypothetical protein
VSLRNLAATVARFATGTYSVTRAANAGTYVDGVFVPGSTSTLSIAASVQPVSGRELQRLPEGLRTRELLSLFTVDALLVEAPGVRPDIITIRSETWQVERVERFAELGNYYHVIVSKEP